MRKKESEQRVARQLRESGRSVTEIAKILGVSKSSAYTWTKDIPTPEKFTPEFKSAQRLRREVAVKKARETSGGRRRKDRVISGDGYWMIPVPKDYKGRTYIKGLYVFEHRYLMEQRLGRLLDSDDVVHHKDGDRLNNSLMNLELVSRASHDAVHAKDRMHRRVQFKCPTCGHVKSRERKQVYLGQGRPKSLIFCSVRCARRYRGLRLSASSHQKRWERNVIREYEATREEVNEGQ